MYGALTASDHIDVTILLAGNSTRFIKSKPHDCKIAHKSLCKTTNKDTIIDDLVWKLDRIPYWLSINIVINNKCNKLLRTEVHKIQNKFSRKHFYSQVNIVTVPYYESNAYSLLASLDYFYSRMSSKEFSSTPNLIIDGDTYISREAAIFIAKSIKEINMKRLNVIFGSRLKNPKGEWGLETSPESPSYPMLSKIIRNPKDNSNLITTGISYIFSPNLRDYLIKSVSSPDNKLKYWDEFYDPTRDNRVNTYVADLKDNLVYEVDTYQDYLDLKDIIKRGTYK